jgi:(2Fe-2S) ferredoxin
MRGRRHVMSRLNMEGLEMMKEKRKAELTLKDGGYRARIVVHLGPCGIAAGAFSVLNSLINEISRAQITDVLVLQSSCGGLCAREPLATVELMGQPPVKYCDLNDKKIRKIFRNHVLDGNIVEKYALAVGCEKTH